MIAVEAQRPGMEPLEERTATIQPQQRTLRMKRSLTKLLTSSSRKFSRSRPSSPTEFDSMTPPTPKIPERFDPKTPTAFDAPPLPPLPVEEMRPRISSQVVKRSREEERFRSEHKSLDVRRRRNMEHSLSPTSREAQPQGSSANPSTVERKKSKTGIRMPSALVSLPRGRGSSIVLPRSKSQPSLRLPERPSTAGNDTSTDKPTGKRRRQITNPGQEKRSSQETRRPSQGNITSQEARRPSYGKHRPSQEKTRPTTPKERVIPAVPQPPGPFNGEDEIAKSMLRSAFIPAASSPVDTASTKRSSIMTKGTSVTELTIDSHSRPVSKGGMTVDDAIEMYVAGFGDGCGKEVGKSRHPSMTVDEEQRRSMRIAEAMSDSIGSSMWSQRPSTSESASSGRARRIDSQGPPPLMPPTGSRDQYGFLKATHHITVAQYDTWYRDYAPVQERRKQKWISFMRENKLTTYQPSRFPARSPKTERYILKGIPPAWRGAAWFHYSGAWVYLEVNPNLYANLVSRCERDLSENDKDSIERDLHRTFPDNIHFKPQANSSHVTNPSNNATPETPLIDSLRRVLRAFALHAPRIGYCQSLNFLAGLLLLFLPEEKAFVMLHVITSDFVPGTHSLNLEGANIDLWVFMQALKVQMPTLWALIGRSPTTSVAASPILDADATAPPSFSLPPISLCTTAWFMSLFLGNLPIESALRVWDSLFYQGPRTLFRTALAIFRIGEKRILATTTPLSSHNTARSNDSVELFQTVQSLPRTLLDAGALMKIVGGKGGITADWVWEKRQERREAIGAVDLDS